MGMQSLKGETDLLYATIARFEGDTKEANALSDKHDADIRDLGKKIQSYEVEFDETNDKLTKAMTNLEEREKAFKNAEEEVSALTRRIMLMEEEAKEADVILKKVKYYENKTMNSEVEIEEFDKNLRETTKMASDNEQKLDELSRKTGVQEDELKRANERAELAEGKLRDVEQELETVGENMKQLEISAEKATEREEKLKDK